MQTVELTHSQTTQPASSDDWADRCRYWAAKADAPPPRKRRQRRTEPLVLTGHGLSVKVDKGCLIVKSGLTHSPPRQQELRFFRGGLDVPPRIVAVEGAGNVSLDALDWMAEQGIAFVRVNYDGTHTMAFSPSGYSTIPEKVRWQLETRDNAERQLEFGIEITGQKLRAAIETIRNCLPKSDNQQSALVITEKAFDELPKVQLLSQLLGLEGPAAKAYWRAWQGIEIRWKAQSRHPIPDDWRAYTSRISLNSGKKWKNWNASHPINAMLNYAYAVLMTEMRIKAISDGYDPMIGILHDQRHYDKERTPSFALDLMEPLRPVVDRAVLQLVTGETFSGADFQLQSDGVCRLNPELARLTAMRVWGHLTEH